MTIYVDIVFFENIFMDLIILIATGIILKEEIKIFRLFLASILGSIYTIISYVLVIRIYSNILLKAILSILIVYIAFNPQNAKKMWKALVMFYVTSFVFGGASFALLYMIKPQDILMKNGLFLGIYPLKIILLAAIIAFIIVVIAFKMVKNKITKKDMLCDIEIKINRKKIHTIAMIDTGNLLKEPISNAPVIVVEHTLLYECIPKEILNNLENIIGGDFRNVPEEIKEKYISKLKFIPFSSLGKQNGMLIGIKAESIIITTEQKIEEQKNVVIGIYNKSLTKNGEYRALMGIESL